MEPGQRESNPFSRRAFLVASGALSTLSFLKILEASVYRALRIGILNPDITDQLTADAEKITAREPESNNEKFRPFTAIIQEGIDIYLQQHPNISVFFKRNSDYKDAQYYADTVMSIANDSLLPTPPIDAIEKLKSKFPEKAFFAYASSNTRFGRFAEIYADGSGLEKRIQREHPELFGDHGQITNFDLYFSILDEEGKNEILHLKSYVENLVKKEKRPISSSYMLAYFLEKNAGDLAQSIYDTAISLKFLTRNDQTTGKAEFGDSNVLWMRQHILDEYQGPSYERSTNVQDTINLIGKPYHSWNLIALLQFFPVELIRVSGMYRQIITINEQGLAKSRADMQTLKDLREIEKLLLKYLKQ